jgi:hypothetical protein
MNSQGITPDTCDAFFVSNETLLLFFRIHYLLCRLYLLYLMVPKKIKL